MSRHRYTSAHHVSSPASADVDASEKSKSQRKREMLALQDIASQLLLLSKERLATIALPDNLRAAIEETRHIRSHEGRRRQMQYLGKLMRYLEASEIAVIHAALDDWYGLSKAHTAELHRLERWRTELLEDDAAMTRLLHDYPHADAQALRTLVRNARKEIALAKPPQQFRALFHALKSLLLASPQSAPPLEQ